MEELGGRPPDGFGLYAQGLENMGSPKQKMEQGIGSWTGEEEGIQSCHKRKPELSAVNRKKSVRSGWEAILPPTLVAVVDETPQIPALIATGVKQTTNAAALGIQKAEGPARVSHDGAKVRPLSMKEAAVFHEFPTKTAHVIQRIVVGGANRWAAAKAGELRDWRAEGRG